MPRPESDADRIRALWANRDYTVADIARKMGMSRRTVLTRAAAMHLPPRRTYSRNARRTLAETAAARAADQARLRPLWEDANLAISDIAAAVGVDRDTVIAWARDMGLPPRRRPRRRSLREVAEKSRKQELLRKLWGDDTMTTVQIAAHLEVARGTVSVWAAELELPERPRGPKRKRPATS